jgi:transposase InsO family protein
MATAGMNTFCCQIDQTPQPAQWLDQRHKCSKWHGLCGCPKAHLKAHNLQPSMSRRGNCHDNAVAESFFQLLKRERIRRKTYATRDEAKQDVFDYIEMFYNPKRRHNVSNRFSPVEYEKQYFERLASV